MITLTSENLVLRNFDSADVPQFVDSILESEASVGKWLPWWKADFTDEDARTWFQSCDEAIAAGTAFDIGIFDKGGASLIGSVAINRIDPANRTGSLGYWVRESQQGRGFCSQAVRRIAKFGFDELDLVRLEIVVLVDNVASRQVAEKCGATLECIAENKLLHQGQPAAAAVYSLTNP